MLSWTDILPTILDYAGYSVLNSPSVDPRLGRSVLPILDKSEQVSEWDKVFGSHAFHEITNFWPTRFLRTRRYRYHRNMAWKLDFAFAADLYASLTWEGLRNSATSGKEAMVGSRSLRNYTRRPPEELYDLENDRQEMNNLTSHPDHQKTVAALRAELERWQMETKDLFLWKEVKVYD